MNSRTALYIQRVGIGRMAERFAGQSPSVARFGANRAGALVLSASYNQPVDTEDESLQDVNGNFYFMAGYSAIGGPDVLR